MLFNSQAFLLLFLPITVALYYLFSRSPRVRICLLICASLVFYGYWDIRFIPLLLGSVVFNWLFASLYRKRDQRRFVILGVALNLLVIGIFKYANFFAENLAFLVDGEFESWNIILPLGISFFTFQQISYLVDLHRGVAPIYPPSRYFLYVTFFPQLIAGPIVRHNEILGQFELDPCRDGAHERLSRGATLLLIGLTKKVVIADRLAEIATPLFDRAANGEILTFAESWLAAGAYSLQLYFDFSGYSDMAIGLALLFGFALPINFNAPYLATSIREFWRRWHMTLSRFLRDYVYVPLGGSRRGRMREAIALQITFLLGGLWHGAAWTFVLWGGLHGIAVVVNHLFARFPVHLPQAIAWLLTMTFVVFGWVLFRADSIATAHAITASMVALNGLSLEVFDQPHRWFVALALIPALVGPTSQRLAFDVLKSRPVWAPLIATCLWILYLRLGDDVYSEFIYFQF
ncbi:MAG: MBOAT family protein [Gammaproteobacteria bacterium]|nr:MBOAT family protein [Gammaproteobacteria bacterium]